MKCRLRESRLIAINEGERSLTAADVSAVYQINGDETKHSVRNRMLANSHAGRDAPAFHLEVSQTTQYKRVLPVLIRTTGQNAAVTALREMVLQQLTGTRGLPNAA